MKKRQFKFIFIPHVFVLFFAFFLLLFSFDVFGGSESLEEQIVGFVIHSIPSILLLIVFFLSRKWPLVGSIVAFLVFVSFTIFFHTYLNIQSFLLISFPIFIIGILYLVAYFKFHGNETI